MNLRRSKWLRWSRVVLGVAELLTQILLELRWIPERQAINAIISLLGFIVLSSGLRELSRLVTAPELVHSTADFLVDKFFEWEPGCNTAIVEVLHAN